MLSILSGLWQGVFFIYVDDFFFHAGSKWKRKFKTHGKRTGRLQASEVSVYSNSRVVK